MERGHSVDYMQKLLSHEYTGNIFYPVELNCPLEGISPDKSTSVYECFPFIWPYNALTADVGLAVPVKGRLTGSCAEKIRFQHSIGKLVTNSSPKLGRFMAFLQASESGKARQAKGFRLLTSKLTR
jgi:hypothetical protein